MWGSNEHLKLLEKLGAICVSIGILLFITYILSGYIEAQANIIIAEIMVTDFQELLIDLGLFALAACATALTVYILCSIGIFIRNMFRKKQPVFIIYDDNDLPTAKQISRRLKRLGFNPWLDSERLHGGEHRENAEGRALANATVTLFLATPNSLLPHSRATTLLDRAHNHYGTPEEWQSRVIPVTVPPPPFDLPQSLQDFVAIDLGSGNSNEKLEHALRKALGATPLHHRLLNR